MKAKQKNIKNCLQVSVIFRKTKQIKVKKPKHNTDNNYCFGQISETPTNITLFFQYYI